MLRRKDFCPNCVESFFSSFVLTNGSIINPFLLFYLELRLCTKIYRFFKYVELWKVLTVFYNPLAMLVVKDIRIPTPVLLQNLGSCLQTAPVVLRLCIALAFQLQGTWKMKRDVQQSTKLFKILGQISDQLYEVGLAKSEIECKEPTIVGFFILQ